MFSTHQMGLSLRIYVILFHSSFLSPLFPSHSEFLSKSLLRPYWPCMLRPYWPCMLWPWVFLWFPPLSLISLHCALDPWPLASGKYAKLASAAESLLGMRLPGYLKFCFLVPFRNLLTCRSFSDPIWNKDHFVCYLFMIYCLSLLTEMVVSWKAESVIYTARSPALRTALGHIESAQ